MKTDPKIGDKVTCKVREKFWYEVEFFEPGMIGEIVTISPKVFVMGDIPPHSDCRKDFLGVVCGRKRVGLNYCNCVPITGKST